MHRRTLLTTLSLFTLPLHSSAKELEGVYQPTQNPCPSVEEAIAKMKVPDGYEVRNFASEPMVINPVAMTWDHRGRLWVVELYEYPSGAKTPNEYSKTATDENFRPVVKTDANSPRDRVVVLEDTDNDGKADKRTVFAEGLNLATAILCGYDGVFIGQAPNMFYFRDTNGDDKADEYKTVLTGFGLEDRHELLNSFCWGPDGYMYFTHGVFTNSKVRRPAEKVEEGNTLNAGVYRVKFTAKDKNPTVAFHEVYADGTSNPWGVDFDARGNAFVEACVIDHLFHMAPGGIYARQGGAPENPYAYELLPSIVQPDQPKHFRAAYAGIQIYQGGIYPADTHGHVFFGNIHDNAIHEEALEPAGATFKAKPIRDFLRANDGWFRPVSIQTGPDGFLWVMDWCDKYPCYQNAQANPAGVDREKGRIWRVCYTGSEAGKKLAGMSREEKEMDVRGISDKKLLEELYTANNWRSRTAIHEIARRREKVIFDELEKDLRTNASAEKKLQILWALMASDRTGHYMETMPQTGKEMMMAATTLSTHAPEAFLRAWSLFAIEHGRRHLLHLRNMDQGIDDACVSSARDPDSSVRKAAAIVFRSATAGTLTGTGRNPLGFTVGDPKEDEKMQAATFEKHWRFLAGLLEASTDADKALALHIWNAFEPYAGGAPGRLLPGFADLAPKTKPLSQVLTYKTARRITDTRSAENMDLLLGFLDKIKVDDVLTAHALDGMLKAQEAGALKPAKYDPAPLFAHWRASKDENVRNLAGRLATLWGDETAVADLIKLAEDEKAPADKRAEALRTLRQLKSPAARAAVLRLLEKSSGGK